MIQKSSHQISYFIFGRGLSGKKWGAAAVAVLALVVASFLLRFGEPVSGEHAKYFVPTLMHQNIDTPGWIVTGLLLPTSSTIVRAPRPLYPAAITAAQAAGIIEQPVMSEATEVPGSVWDGAVKVLAAENILMAIVSLWLFMALCRYYGVSYLDSICAAVFAGTCFGFNFWIAQLTPEILTFFAVMLLFIMVIWIDEAATHRSLIIRTAITGAIVGIFLLGKELYFLVLFVVMLLCWKKRWSSCAIFVVTAAVPLILWRVYITQILQVFDPGAYNKQYGYFVWLRETLFEVPLSTSVIRLFENFGRQIRSFGEAFLYYPLILMIWGMAATKPKCLLAPLLCFALAFSAMYFGSNFIKPRISFMAWPVVCGFAWLGISAAAKKLTRSSQGIETRRGFALKIAILVLHACIQFLPVYHLIDYG